MNSSISVSDFLSEYLSTLNIDKVFSLPGGFSMGMNYSFGKNSNYKIVYNHHEQGCGYGAIGYSKTTQKIPIVCVTAGCAATNVITPCLVAYQDRVPLIILSGQAKSSETIRSLKSKKNINLRHYSGADCNIIDMVQSITIYSNEVDSVESFFETLINIKKLLTKGLTGPIWVSIPVDIQNVILKNKDMDKFLKLSNEISNNYKNSLNLQIDDKKNIIFEEISELINGSKRPLFLIGNGIRNSNSIDKFKKIITSHKMPTVVSFHGLDVLNYDDNLFIGRVGLVGNRNGNFAIQNCDLLICLGCRMAQGIVGYRSDWFCREGKIIYIDIDDEELKKTNINYDIKMNCSIEKFLANITIDKNKKWDKWAEICLRWKHKWSLELPVKKYNKVSPYFFLNSLFKKIGKNKIVIASSGSIYNVVWHQYQNKEGDRYIVSTQGDMGFEIPCSIGCQIGKPESTVIPILGDGSFEFNLQELQTIIHQNLKIKIIVFNNGGYGAIRISQKKFFGETYGTELKDMTFPKIKKIADTYGFNYIVVDNNNNIDDTINQFISTEGPLILEVVSDTEERFPILSAKKNEDGSFTSKPFEDMKPFLDRDEFYEEMIVKPLE